MRARGRALLGFAGSIWMLVTALVPSNQPGHSDIESPTAALSSKKERKIYNPEKNVSARQPPPSWRLATPFSKFGRGESPIECVEAPGDPLGSPFAGDLQIPPGADFWRSVFRIAILQWKKAHTISPHRHSLRCGDFNASNTGFMVGWCIVCPPVASVGSISRPALAWPNRTRWVRPS